MDEAWEILQVSEINWVKVNTLGIIVCYVSKSFLSVCKLRPLKYACAFRNIRNVDLCKEVLRGQAQHGITGSRIILTGYDTMVMFLLLFTNRKSFQSISFSLGETDRVTGRGRTERQ